MLARAPFQAARRTIDISGDGTHNSGRGLLAAREDALAKGVTINGLVILSERPLPWNPEHTNPPGGLAKYFQDNVIGGPGAFVMVAENFQSFGQALICKADRRDRRGAGSVRPTVSPAVREAFGCSLVPADRQRKSRRRKASISSIDKPLVSIDSRLRSVWNYSNLLIRHRNLP